MAVTRDGWLNSRLRFAKRMAQLLQKQTGGERNDT